MGFRVTVQDLGGIGLRNLGTPFRKGGSRVRAHGEGDVSMKV